MTTPNPGSANLAISFTCAGAPHVSVITLSVAAGSLGSAAAIDAALRTSMSATGSFFRADKMMAAFTVINTYVLWNNGGLLYVNNNPTTIVGTVVASPPPLNTALIIRKNTGIAGRQYRGRMFCPPTYVPEGNISAAGVIDGSTVTAADGALGSFYSALIANGLTPYLYHEPPKTGPTPAPTMITSFKLTPLIGSIKRRIRQ